MKEHFEQKERIEKKLANHENELRNLKKNYESEIYELEKKVLIDKCKLKEEMMQKLNKLGSQLQNIFNQKISETTKQTIQENNRLNVELNKLTCTTNELFEKNNFLKNIASF